MLKCKILLNKIENACEDIYFIGLTPDISMVGKYKIPVAAVVVSKADQEIIMVSLPDMTGKPVEYNCTDADISEIRQFIEGNKEPIMPNLNLSELLESLMSAKVVSVVVEKQERKGNYKFNSEDVLVTSGFRSFYGEEVTAMITGIIATLQTIRDAFFLQKLVVNGIRIVAIDEVNTIRLMLEEEYNHMCGVGI